MNEQHYIRALFLLVYAFPGVCADIAPSKHEHWSSFAPLPFEVVISAGQKAKESWNESSSYFFIISLSGGFSCFLVIIFLF